MVRDAGRIALPVIVAGTAAAGGAAAVLRPGLVAVGIVALTVLAAMVLRVEWAVLAYVAVEPFGDLVATIVSPSVKLVGAVLFAAWLVRLALDSRPVALRHPSIHALGFLFLALLAATVWNPNGSAAVEVVSRYLSYMAVLVVLVDTMRTSLPPRRVVVVFVWSCTLAALVGLVAFHEADGGRAAGPMEDANDFAFYLVCALPFALLLWREATGALRHLHALAALVLVLGIAATFSRGALLALLVMVPVALALGLIRPRQVAAGAGLLALATVIAVAVMPGALQRSLDEKQYVAEANVASRYTSWALAAEMTADHPVLGTGPGGFRTNVDSYESRTVSDTTHLDVVHQMQLEVSSELGLVGLGAFLAVIGAGLAGALRAARRGSPREAPLAVATVVGTAGALVAAAFLSEQYYLPIWLLVALGAALDRDLVNRAHKAGVEPCAQSSS